MNTLLLFLLIKNIFWDTLLVCLVFVIATQLVAINTVESIWIGDSIQSQKSDNIWFWFQNCNMMVYKNDIREFEYDIALLAEKDINNISFSETCINTNKPGYVRKLQDSFCSIISNSVFSLTNSPKYPKRSCYQPRGVAAGFSGILCSRFLREGSDCIGRWIWHEFGHGNMITRIYAVYQVNDGSETTSGS